MQLQNLFVVFFSFAAIANSFPYTLAKRDSRVQYNESVEIQTISKKSPINNVKTISDSLSRKTSSLFFNNDTYIWSDNCNSTKTPVVWPVAVAGKVLANTQDEAQIDKATSALKNYRNPNGGYSTSMKGDDQIYTDDDGQISWIFSSAYETTSNEKYLEENKKLMNFLVNQTDSSKGGIKWLITDSYIALISTLEVAVAALQLDDIGGDEDFIPFAKDCILWTLDNLVDNSSSNPFIFDGIYKDGSINKGKLTYTVGTLISACAYLVKLGEIDHDWQGIAVTFGTRFISSGKLDNQFFTDGHINDIIERSHLVFVGFADLLEFTIPKTDYQKRAYKAYEDLIVREARYLYDKHSDVINNDECPSGDFSSLLKYASLAQVFYEVGRIADKI